MWLREYSKKYDGLTKKQIFETWQDVNRWSEWLIDVDSCKMDGVFEVGNYFMFKPKGVGVIRVELTEVVPEHRFTDCVPFFGAKMFDTHEVRDTPGGIELVSRIRLTGVLSFLWAFLVVNDIAKTAPQEMESLVAYVRKRYQ